MGSKQSSGVSELEFEPPAGNLFGSTGAATPLALDSHEQETEREPPGWSPFATGAELPVTNLFEAGPALEPATAPPARHVAPPSTFEDETEWEPDDHTSADPALPSWRRAPARTRTRPAGAGSRIAALAAAVLAVLGSIAVALGGIGGGSGPASMHRPTHAGHGGVPIRATATRPSGESLAALLAKPRAGTAHAVVPRPRRTETRKASPRRSRTTAPRSRRARSRVGRPPVALAPHASSSSSVSVQQSSAAIASPSTAAAPSSQASPPSTPAASPPASAPAHPSSRSGPPSQSEFSFEQ
jgi:hypothetical protein